MAHTRVGRRVGRSGLWIIILVGTIAASACGGDTERGGQTTTTERADTECADAPDPGEVDTNPDAYPNLDEAVRIATLCWTLGRVRPFWPDGVSMQDALNFVDRVQLACGGGQQMPATPPEWYDQHDGPSTEVDDFALGIAFYWC